MCTYAMSGVRVFCIRADAKSGRRKKKDLLN